MKRTKKKIPVLAAAIIIAAVAAGGCLGNRKPGGGGKLYIYNWTYYTPPSVIEKFEKEYGVTVVYDEFASNEEMFAKLQAGGTGYDIIFPSEDYVSIMISLGLLEKLDKSRLSNLDNVDPRVLQKTKADPVMEYSVPYYWGASGVLVNTAKVPDFEKSWSIFARTDLKGRMTMLDDMREVLGDALAYLGYSVNSKDPAQIEEARDLVNNTWKPNLVKFDAEAFGKGYSQGDFWVVHGYAEVVYEEIAGNEELINNTVFFIPDEGGPAYIDGMCILKGAKNIDLAHKFIDFIHRPEIYAEFTDFFGFPPTANYRAAPYKQDDPLYLVEDLANTEIKDDLGEALEMYNDAWETIKVGY
ncbi:MAG: extracellular solute-binding protein [Spirochaetaceae bacterium]|jgi:spermidine/putrescine transport system substrate-binding protein|nr:extracellular solute-binding protein [Spirochaetaceae bacterium]